MLFKTPITLPADPTSALHAGTKQYIDAGDAVDAAFSTRVETLANSSTLSPNALSGAIQVGVCSALTSATTLNAPSNGTVGAPYRAIITASGGPWVITLSGWVGSTDDATTAISLPSGKTVSIMGEYIGPAGWLYNGYKLQA